MCPHRHNRPPAPGSSPFAASSPFSTASPFQQSSVASVWEDDDDGATAISQLPADFLATPAPSPPGFTQLLEQNQSDAPTSVLTAEDRMESGPFTPIPHKATTDTRSAQFPKATQSLKAVAPTPLPPESSSAKKADIPQYRAAYIGRKIGHFLLEKKIGQGGFGAVFQAQHTLLNQRVAIKVLNINQQTPDIVERFRREARALTMLRHDNVVHIADFGQNEELGFYLAMEYLEGKSLQDAINAKEHFTLGRLHNLFMQLSSVMFYAHNKGILHRDLKPSNIFLISDGGAGEKVKLIDFGIASIVEEGNELTQSGTSLGSPTYMSPEQARGEKSTDARTDVYAMGVILMQLLAGKAPFQGPNYASILTKKLFESPPRLSDLNPDKPWSEALEAFLLRCISDDQSRRPLDAQQFWQECEAALNAQGMAYPDNSRWSTGEWVVDSGQFPMLTGHDKTPQPGTFWPDPTDSSQRRPEALLTSPEDSVQNTQSFVKARPSTLLSTLPDADFSFAEDELGLEAPPTTPKAEAVVNTEPKRRSLRWILLVMLLIGSLVGLWKGLSPPVSDSNDSSPIQIVANRKRVGFVTTHRPSVRFNPQRQRGLTALVEWRFRSLPSGAEVWKGNKRLGVTPFTWKARPGTQVYFLLKRRGFRSLPIQHRMTKDNRALVYTLKALKKTAPRVSVVRPRPKSRPGARRKVHQRPVRRRSKAAVRVRRRPRVRPRKRNLYGIDDPI